MPSSFKRLLLRLQIWPLHLALWVGIIMLSYHFVGFASSLSFLTLFFVFSFLLPLKFPKRLSFGHFVFSAIVLVYVRVSLPCSFFDTHTHLKPWHFCTQELWMLQDFTKRYKKDYFMNWKERKRFYPPNKQLWQFLYHQISKFISCAKSELWRWFFKYVCYNS